MHSAVRGRAVRMGHEQDENSTLSRDVIGKDGMRKLYISVVVCVLYAMPIFGNSSNSVNMAIDPWGDGNIDPYYKDATFPPDHSTESPVFLKGIATNGISATGCAFMYAWYGDAFRLFGLLDVMQSNGVDVTTLRMGSEHESFTQNWDSPHFSLLHVAVLRGHTNIVRELVTKYGLSLNDKGPKGAIESPLRALLSHRPDRLGLVDVPLEEYTEMALLLIELGARPDGSRELGTAVMTIKDEDFVEALLKSGADPNSYEPEDMCPIIQLVEPSSDKILKLLVDYGADLYATNFLGSTIFDHAEVDPKTKAQLKRLGLYPEADVQSNLVSKVHEGEAARNGDHGGATLKSANCPPPHKSKEHSLESEVVEGVQKRHE